MEENILEAPPEFKINSLRSINLATFLGGPLAAGYLVAGNFRKLGELRKFRITWIITIFATIAIFGILLFVPGVDKVPNYVFPLLYVAVITYLAKRFQGEAIKSHAENGGAFFSVWRGVLAGVLAGVITLALVFGLLYVLGAG